MRRYLPLLMIVTLPGHAAGLTKPIQVNANVGNACVIATNNTNQSIYLDDYSAIDIPTTPRNVAIVTYCNRNTIPVLLLNGLAGNTEQDFVLKQGSNELKVLVSMSGTSGNSTNPLYPNATRYVRNIQARYPSTPQFNAPFGEYTGTVVFSVEF